MVESRGKQSRLVNILYDFWSKDSSLTTYFGQEAASFTKQAPALQSLWQCGSKHPTASEDPFWFKVTLSSALHIVCARVLNTYFLNELKFSE